MTEQLTLAQWRKLRGLSQKELALKSGVSERSIWEYEKKSMSLDNSSYSTIKNICMALNIKTEQIFYSVLRLNRNERSDNI